MKATAAASAVGESVAALNRSSGLKATHHASSKQGVSPPLLAELVTILSKHQTYHLFLLAMLREKARGDDRTYAGLEESLAGRVVAQQISGEQIH